MRHAASLPGAGCSWGSKVETVPDLLTDLVFLVVFHFDVQDGCQARLLRHLHRDDTTH